MEYAIQLLIPLFAGLYLGKKLDQLFGASPWGIIVCAILGLAAGVFLMYRKLQYKAQKEAKAAEKQPKLPKRVPPKRTDEDDDEDRDDHPYGL